MKKLFGFLAAALIALLAAVPAGAEGGGAWAVLKDQAVMMYLQDAPAEDIKECTIGNIPVKPASVKNIKDLEHPVETVILLDNSGSIPPAERQAVREILFDLVANRLEGETFTLALIGEDVRYMCEGEREFSKIKEAIEGIAYQTQSTYITDGVCDVLKGLMEKEDGVLRRLLIIADGADHQELGYTQEEMQDIVSAAGYPVYVLGSSGKDSGASSSLKELFALSRLTDGQAFQLKDLPESMEVVRAVTACNSGVCIEIPIPGEACNGAQWAVGCQGAVITLTMPVKAAPEPTPTPAPTIAPTEAPAAAPPEPAPEGSSGLSWVWVAAIAAAAAAAAGGVAAAAVLIWKKRRKTQKKDPFEHMPPAQSERVYEGETVLRPSQEADGGTVLMWDRQNVKALLLEDMANPGRRFNVPLEGAVSVGRDAKCTVAVTWDATVSREQCELYQQGGQVMVRNVSHSNVTLLDGSPAEKDTPVKNGSVLTMGSTAMRISII